MMNMPRIFFDEYLECKIPITCTTTRCGANALYAVGIGHVPMTVFDSKGYPMEYRFKNILHVPQAPANILPLYRMVVDGWAINVTATRMTFCSGSREIVAHQRRGMWYLTTVPGSLEEERVAGQATAFVTMEQEIATIHESYAHLSLNRLKEAAVAGSMPGVPTAV